MTAWQRHWAHNRQLLKQHETKLRFVLVGGFNTAFGLAAYPVLFMLTAPLKLHYLVVLIVTQVICVVVSFLTTKRFVFRTQGQYLREFGKFSSFHVGTMLLNLAALPVLVEFLGMTPMWGQTLFSFFLIVGSYFWHRHITFSTLKVDR